MKQFTSYFTHGVRNGSELRRNVHTSRTTAEILDRVDTFFAGAGAQASACGGESLQAQTSVG
jgi:hypothetical protein